MHDGAVLLRMYVIYIFFFIRGVLVRRVPVELELFDEHFLIL